MQAGELFFPQKQKNPEGAANDKKTLQTLRQTYGPQGN